MNESASAMAEAAPGAPHPRAGAFGSLIDADLARETAQLADLQNRQSRAGSADNARCTPQTLLSLFGDA